MAEHKHLRRLDYVWIEPAIYFLTVCVRDRKPLLANHDAHAVLRSEFLAARDRHHWRIGRYVVMPDHVHFFCASEDTQAASSLSSFVGRLKQWSAKGLVTQGAAPPVWQKQFFDHLLRHGESYDRKWDYVRENPVRAGLVSRADDWPYCGEIDSLEM